MKVGVFDSGLGGLTIVKEISKNLRGMEIFYIADTLFTPYGEKSKNEILQHSLDIVNYLINKHQINALIVACNTATSVAIKYLRDKFPNLIVVGAEPGIKPAMKMTISKNVGVLATLATLNGQKYQKLLKSLLSKYKVNLHEQACVGLVEQIEKGKIDHIETKTMLEYWLKPMNEKSVDTIVLGCTHYPLVLEQIKKIMGENINLVQTDYAISKRLKNLLQEREHENSGAFGIKIFYTSNINKNMINMILEDWQDGGKIVVRDTND